MHRETEKHLYLIVSLSLMEQRLNNLFCMFVLDLLGLETRVTQNVTHITFIGTKTVLT